MKVLVERKPFENWSLEVECNGLNWNQEDKVPCGSSLEINKEDLLIRGWLKYPDREGKNYGFICPVCGCFTEIKDELLNDDLKKLAKDYLKNNGNKTVTIATYTIKTGMGQSSDWYLIPNLTEENVKILNDIGYGTNKEFTRVDYLNSLDPNIQYNMKQTKWDDGSFMEQFEVTRVVL